MAGSARLFVAACLPAGVRTELARWARGAVVGGNDGGRRLVAESMHLTLCFLGEQPIAGLEDLAAILGGAAESVARVGALEVGAPAWLPPRRPRALAVEIGDPSGGLGELRRVLAGEIAASIGWHAGPQRFRPHVTVARMRPGAGRSNVSLPTPQLAFDLNGVALFRSQLEPDGARYEELASVGRW